MTPPHDNERSDEKTSGEAATQGAADASDDPPPMSSESTETSSEGSLEHPSGDPAHLRVYFDADVIFAGAASPSDHSASQVLLALSESTLIEGVTSALAVDECRRNLEAKLPAATGDFDHVVDRSLRVAAAPSRDALRPHSGRADWKDLPHLVAAFEQDCSYLTTYNVGDYEPGHPEVDVLRPGALVRRIRAQLASL